MLKTLFFEAPVELTEDEVDGGYSASAIGYGIHTEGDSMEEIRRNVREAVDCYFDEGMERPGITCLHDDAQLPEPHKQVGAEGRARANAHG